MIVLYKYGNMVTNANTELSQAIGYSVYSRFQNRIGNTVLTID